MAGAEERKSVFYLQQICSDIKRNVFKTPWGSILIHNCDKKGKLLDFKSVQEFKDSCQSLWLNMKLLIFKKDHGEFPVWCCPECPSMRGVLSMGVQHNEEDLLQYLCVHSRTASFLVPDWQTIWNVRVAPGVTSLDVQCNTDIEAVTCKEYKKGDLFLAAVLAGGKVHVLYTVTKRQVAPICKTFPAPFCSTQRCKHFKRYEEIMEEGYVCIFSPTFGQHEEENENEIEQEQSATELQPGRDPPVDDEQDDEQDDTNARPFNLGSKDHYLRNLTDTDFSEMCGYNFSKIPYPFKRSTQLQSVWLKRQKNEYEFPSHFIPEYSDKAFCDQHGNKYEFFKDDMHQYVGNMCWI